MPTSKRDSTTPHSQRSAAQPNPGAVDRETSITILAVDDDPMVLVSVRRMVSDLPVTLLEAGSAQEALAILAQVDVDIIISDLSLPDMGGIHLLEQSREDNRDRPFIVITGFASIESAVEAMQKGAYDYIEKPLRREDFLTRIQKALRMAEMVRELRELRLLKIETKSPNPLGGRLVGQSKAMQDLFKLINRIAASYSIVLIQGESGTGKELVARAIHEASPRQGRPFVAINCGVLPEGLLESELFGHVQGAFTSAVRNKKGLFQEANGGTIFLDEIGDISPAMQVKLLRVLQEREVKPVGSTESHKVDIRVVAASNKSLKDLVAQGSYREDLYFRIAVITLLVPSLRDRRDDIPRLMDYFLSLLAQTRGTTRKDVSPEALSLLMSYDWPGNVRELENVVERAVLMGATETIVPEDLPDEIHGQASRQKPRGQASTPFNLPDAIPGNLQSAVDHTVAQVEAHLIKQALIACNHNKVQVAKRLGISRGTLYNKLRRYGLDDSEPRT